jgi:hypothetical protein
MIRRSICMAFGSAAVAAVVQPAAAQTACLAAGPVVAPVTPPPPAVTRALLPGHWQLRGAAYVWAPPETTLRVVQDRPLIPGQNVWQDGSWVFVPTHYATPG